MKECVDRKSCSRMILRNQMNKMLFTSNQLLSSTMTMILFVIEKKIKLLELIIRKKKFLVIFHSIRFYCHFICSKIEVSFHLIQSGTLKMIKVKKLKKNSLNLHIILILDNTKWAAYTIVYWYDFEYLLPQSAWVCESWITMK